MARLLSFTKDEKTLFEALWLIYRGGDHPDAKEVKTSIRLEDYVKSKSEEGGSIKLVMCQACGQRIMQHEELRTINGPVDLLLEKEAFDYLKSCFNKYKQVTYELRRPFDTLQDRFDECKEKPVEEWQAFIKKRDEVPAAVNGATAEPPNMNISAENI